MLQSVAARCGVGIHPSLQRSFIATKQCLGLSCQPQYSFYEGEVLAVVPFWCCPSPLVALASPWGDALERALGTYEAQDGKVKVAFPRDSAITAVFTALALAEGSPIQTYLQYIEPSVVSPAAELGNDALVTIQRLTDDLARALLADARRAGLSLDEGRLQFAMRACQSRCMDVPESDDVLGGPALVPIADLVNHDGRVPNVAVGVTTDTTMRALVKRNHAKSGRAVDVRPLSSHCPFFCVMVATEDVQGGAELTYQYVDPDAEPTLYKDDLFWLSRFAFAPRTSP